jgi:hypothetical protein
VSIQFNFNNGGIMTDFGKLYTRTPRRVYARQWLPYSNLPYTESVFIDVPAPQTQAPFEPSDILKNQDVTNYFQSIPKQIKVCVSGIVTLGNGDRIAVEPLDYVLYSETSQVPIAVITEKDFLASYTDQFELCPICLAKSQAMRSGGSVPTFQDLIKALEEGKAITLQDGTKITTFLDLQNWAGKNGLVLG